MPLSWNEIRDRAMLLRTARKGLKTGQQFWGCSGYPDCRETRPLPNQG